MIYVYGYFNSKDEAEHAFVTYCCEGIMSECELSRIYPAFGGKLWAIELKA